MRILFSFWIPSHALYTSSSFEIFILCMFIYAQTRICSLRYFIPLIDVEKINLTLNFHFTLSLSLFKWCKVSTHACSFANDFHILWSLNLHSTQIMQSFKTSFFTPCDSRILLSTIVLVFNAVTFIKHLWINISTTNYFIKKIHVFSYVKIYIISLK